MQASTPINSPMRKKHSLVQRFVHIDETLGDIESEIQSRRQEAINKSTESRRRLSTVPLLAGYTATQLTQHCKDVIKLSTENKINCKNAFNFWLIDVMAAMAKKNDSEINKNFQVASCTLDASVKIYGYRVDAIHTDAVKMAGGFFSKEVQTPDDENDGNEGENENGEEATAKVKTKKKKKKLTVVRPETLNAKSEAEVLLDVVPRPNFLSRKTDGNNLLVKIPKYNDGGLLLLDSDYPCWPYGETGASAPKFEAGELFDHESLLSLMSDISVSKEEHLCETYKDVEFGKTYEGDDSDDELQTSQNSGRFEFDINASIHDDVSFDEEPINQRNRINIPAGGFDSDQEIVVEPEQQKKSISIGITDMKTRISVNPLEYSMFDQKIFKAWAGPAHWKVRPIRKPLEEFSNNEDVSKPVASKRARKGKTKSPAGLFDLSEDVLDKNLTESEKTTLFKSTMLNWNLQNTTIPKDLKCQSRNLFSLYHIPSFTVTCRYASEESSDLSDPSADGDERENEDEVVYCSTSGVHDDNISHHSYDDQNPGKSGGEGGCEDDAWDMANMVEAPNKVEKIQVSTFKRRKHVDIKHLKRGLWGVLTKTENEEQDKEKKVEEAIEFRDLIKTYSGKVTKSFGSLLSAPLIFNALLHLTNEKSLVLTQNKTNSLNFVISQ
ncbi:hypothetical protein RUM43_007944 [Polyplax serrata]|uniref:Condensin complex subunit 2 n=1 Tax=Polyplax serrata TaxID=468196 RepID=A0AAN8PE30_POLSC